MMNLVKTLPALFALLAVQAAPGLGEPRQLTSGGTHAEAYWSPDGKKIVLMGERPGDPADQIYELDVATGALARVSTGLGKAT
jgi:Tol biopolymer transport system component